MAVWAIPIDTVKLGSHIESFVQARPVAKAFKLTVGIAARQESSPVGKLPHELVNMIGRQIEHDVLYGRGSAQTLGNEGLLKKWEGQIRCLAG